MVELLSKRRRTIRGPSIMESIKKLEEVLVKKSTTGKSINITNSGIMDELERIFNTNLQPRIIRSIEMIKRLKKLRYWISLLREDLKPDTDGNPTDALKDFLANKQSVGTDIVSTKILSIHGIINGIERLNNQSIVTK